MSVDNLIPTLSTIVIQFMTEFIGTTSNKMMLTIFASTMTPKLFKKVTK